MEDYKICFQTILDNFSLTELADFKIRLDQELDKRMDAKKHEMELEKQKFHAIEYLLHEAIENGKEK
tara:strand:- start:2360 stop:2560 length:201 start_codon:yes stop_codon:yes gene_type:complete